MIDRIDFKNKKLIYFPILFLISVCASVIFLYIERKILGISSTYHPDSALYIDSSAFKAYAFLSFEFSLMKNLQNLFTNLFHGTIYFSISNLFYELNKISDFNFNQYRSLIKLNIFLFCITNLIILNAFIKNSENYKIKFFICILIYFFLPYKLHLAVNILKETFVLFFLVLYLFYSNIYTFIISFILGTSLRSLFSLYFLNYLNFKNIFSKKNFLILISILLTWLFVITLFISIDDFTSSFLNFIYERNFADMGGRNYDNIPNFSEKGYWGILLRVILWPFFFLTGTFIFYSDSFFLNILAFEIIILQLMTFFCRKKFVISAGLIIFLFLLSLYATSFTAFFRYAYLAIQIVFLKTFFKL